jgi:hypothetical protein
MMMFNPFCLLQRASLSLEIILSSLAENHGREPVVNAALKIGRNRVSKPPIHWFEPFEKF